ncbi:NADPH-dependent oxidoreductase [Lentilactobacillus diolivorans]|uniref:Oxygen-insensitive NADPH nitroreductase n=2 Tax=Lentilactobacillus diolivorans TaxID=179838 RepID=A0A0R1S7E5_9LACO|nr:NADPH-dependent oxidoreductase [Lentilactobacillus diolivorans]KRL64847.1 oxygen-insensitive NADPH nitroreductase [Lentilactobacillus diolivorans DSM 14421]GEP24895.1 NADPH-dependent oxidoreductase [Lentilactobacillus diolivorans]
MLHNEILDLLSHHRSIRHFRNQQLTREQVDTLIQAAQHASTSTFSQQYSIISLTQPDAKKELAEITGHHWLQNSGHYFVVVADQYRNLQIAQANDVDPYILRTADKFFAGVFDATIATENIMVAAESMGLGGTIMGSILNDTSRLIKLLKLPELTFPVLGIALGYPASQPELKPRLPMSEIHFDDTYQLSSNFKADLSRYDQLVSNYYQERGQNNRIETFSHHIISELGRNREQRADLIKNIREQGFILK